MFSVVSFILVPWHQKINATKNIIANKFHKTYKRSREPIKMALGN